MMVVENERNGWWIQQIAGVACGGEVGGVEWGFQEMNENERNKESKREIGDYAARSIIYHMHEEGRDRLSP